MNTTRLLILGLLACALLTSPHLGLGAEPPVELSGVEGGAAAGSVRVIRPAEELESGVPDESVAAEVMRVLPAGGVTTGEREPLLTRDKMVGMRYRLDRQAAGSGVVGNDTGDTSFDLFWPFEANGDDRFMFLDLRTRVNDQGRGGASAGIGYRSYNEQLDRIFGLSGWWDWDNSHHRTYRQAGISFESLGQFFDFRVNGYFPLTTEYHTVHDSTDLSNPYFGGFNILVDRTRVFESNYRGVDAEVGGPLPVLGRYGARGYMGIYHWSSENDRDTTGWKARVETQVTDDVMVGVSVSRDTVFGTNTWLNIVLTLPDGRPETFFRPQSMRQRLNGLVRRNGRVVVNRRRQVDGVPLVQSSGAGAGDPIELVWIDPNAAFNGTGSYESPLNNLEAYNNLPENDMLIVGSGDLSGSLTLFDDQILLSEWVLNQQQYVLDTTSGPILLPGVDPLATKPTFRNPVGLDGNDGGSIVTIAGSNTQIGGMIFDGQTDIIDVYANAITTAPGWTIGGFDIFDNEFDRTRNSVAFTNNSSIGSAAALGIFERNLLRGNGNDSIAGFQLTATDGSLLNLRVADNTVSNYLGEDLDNDGVLDPGEDANGNGVLDAGVAFSITAREGAVINAVSIPGDPADPNDPGLVLGITNNVAVGNGTGLLLLSETEGVINADVSGNTFNNNFDPNTGVSITADAGTIYLLNFSNNDVSNNLGVGMRLKATGGGLIASVANEDRNRNGVLDPTEDSNGNGLLDIGEDLNGNGILDGPEDVNGNGILDLGFTGNTLIGNGGDGLVAMVNDGSITDLHIGSASDLLTDDMRFDVLAEVDANADGFLNHGNGNGLLEPGEDVNGNGVLDAGEDDNEDLNNNGIRDLVDDRFIGALPNEDVNGDGVLNQGNGDGVLDPGEDVNNNGLLDFGEDFDEDVNSNGLLDGPDNIISGNGVTLPGPGSGIVLMTLPTEDLNGNGTLELGEDANGNGRLDLGSGVITAGLVNTVLDTTYLPNALAEDGAGELLNETNSGSHLSITSYGGSLGTGTVSLSTITNNSMTGAGLDSITINSNNTGSVLIGEINNSTLDNNSRHGINVQADTGTVSLGVVDSNTFNRIYNGGDGIHVDSENGVITGVVTRSRFQGDAVGNLVGEDVNGNGLLDTGEDLNNNGRLDLGPGIGVVVRATGGNVSLEIGQTDRGNLFYNNIGAGIEYTMIESGQGRFAIRDNQIFGTIDDGIPLSVQQGDGILVRAIGSLLPGTGSPLLEESIIDGNLIGSIQASEDVNGNGVLDPGEDINLNGTLDAVLGNEGSGIVFDIQEQATVRNVWIGHADDDSLTGNKIVNNALDGIFIERLDDAIIDGIFIRNNLIEANGLAQPFSDRKSVLGSGVNIVARDGGDSLLLIDAQFNEIRGNQFNGVKVLIDGDARVKFDMFRNLVRENGIGDPTGANLTAGILTLENFNDSTDSRELVGTWQANRIIANNGYGIRFDATATSLYNLAEPDVFENDMQILGNLIDGNGLDGIEFNGMGRLLIDSNDIVNNGFNADLAGAGTDDNGNGIDIQAVLLDAAGNVVDQRIEPELAEMPQAASRKIVYIDRNNIIGNLLDGLEIRHANNPSGVHGHNSQFAPLHPGHFPLEVVVRENTIENNGGRGIDILNQGGRRRPRDGRIDVVHSFDNEVEGEFTGEDVRRQFSPTDSLIRLLNNEIRSNNKEGIYVVNTSSLEQEQSGNTETPDLTLELEDRPDATRGMASAGDEDAVPRLVLEIHENQVFDNGQLLDSDSSGAGIPSLSGSGLVLRVGTSDRRLGLDSYAIAPGADQDLLDEYLGEHGFFNFPQPGGVIAKVSSSEFGSNFGSDVYIESFRSTITPEFDINPMSRLDMIFENNVGDSLSVTNHGAWYTGEDGIRSNAQNVPLSVDAGGVPTPIYGYVVGAHGSTVMGGPVKPPNPNGKPNKTTFDGSSTLDTRSGTLSYGGNEAEFLSGPQNGAWRFIASYNGSTHRTGITPDYSSAPEVGDVFQFELSTSDWFDVALVAGDPRYVDPIPLRDGDNPATNSLNGGLIIKFVSGVLAGESMTLEDNYAIDLGNAPDDQAGDNLFKFHFDVANLPVDNGTTQPGGVVKSGVHNPLGTNVTSNQTLDIAGAFPRPPQDGDLFLLSASIPGQGPSAFRVDGALISGVNDSIETNSFDVHDLGFEHKVSLETRQPPGDELPFQWDLMTNDNSDRIRSFFDVLPNLSTVPPVTYKDFLP